MRRPPHPFSLLLGDRGGGQRSAQSHGFDRRGGHDHHGALFADGFVEHVHAAQMQRAGVVVVDARGFGELFGDLRLRLRRG